MNFRPRTWALVSLLLFLAGGWFWHLGNQRAARRHPNATTNNSARKLSLLNRAAADPFHIVSAPPSANLDGTATNAAAWATNRFRYRLSNTSQTMDQLTRNDRAILLRNALFDTSLGARLPIPDHLRAHGDPESYIVQSRESDPAALRKALKEAGAEIVSYIPNNAYLVRAEAAVAAKLSSGPLIQAVLPLEPYYKLEPQLLARAVENIPLPEDSLLNVVVFPGQRDRALGLLAQINAEVVAEESSPFGQTLTVRTRADGLVKIARMPVVQVIETFRTRQSANDLTRVRLRVSTNAVAAAPAGNYLGLTGNGVLVNVNDTGVDSSHPDLAGRVFGDTLAALGDADGHGTHVAGTIAGDGTKSTTVSNALGSVPGANFRGMAPKANILSLQYFAHSDQELQELAALTNALISNNGWTYGGNDYDLHAASFDAATRDALTGVTNAQPVLFVFPAGNHGNGTDGGLAGAPDSIESPGTAKNVITVGASELLRHITNLVTVVNADGTTNHYRPWAGMTDSSNQVAGFSSRGNTGIGLEGTYGRFKPDVVAPGAMLVSCRSSNFVLTPPSNLNGITENYSNVFLPAHTTNLFSLSVQAAAPLGFVVGITPNAQSPNPFPSLPVDIAMNHPPPPADASGTNGATLPSPPLTNGVVFYTVINPTSHGIWLDMSASLLWTNNPGDYWNVLSNLNSQIGPWYRYEWGSSMAAAAVSGTLALMREYFQQNLGLTNESPALLKALLINGARSINSIYDFHPQKVSANIQGWGLVNISNTLPAAPASASQAALVQFIEQDAANALATGYSHTRVVTPQPTSRGFFPLRLTLAWTDPPANPLVGAKLVNDLSLIVTNLDKPTEVFVGNYFAEGSLYSQPIGLTLTSSTNGTVSTNLSATNFTAALDLANNVENVYIPPPLASRYSITVQARRVYVDAVDNADTAPPSGIMQDYALVASVGRFETNGGLRLDPAIAIGLDTNRVVKTYNTNYTMLLHERVGANPPYLTDRNGLPEQWNFYVFSNMTAFSNVAIMTFLPQNVAFLQPNQASPSKPRYYEADIDLYVSHDPALLILDAVALANADRSVGRLGTEWVIYTNVPPGQIYYIGVKSEDQQAADYSIMAMATAGFSGLDTNGNQTVYGYPVDIPDGCPDSPGGTNIVAFATFPMKIQRVIVTNIITHQLAGDLIGILSHEDAQSAAHGRAVLNNHRMWYGTETAIYDDSQRNDAPGITQLSDGPGSLTSFIGQEALGPWTFTISDNACQHTGRVDVLNLLLEPSQSHPTRPIRIGAHGWLYEAVDIPADATNLHVCVQADAPVDVLISQGVMPTMMDIGAPNVKALIGVAQGCIDWNIYESPPLTVGLWYVGVYNPNNVDVNVLLSIDVQRNFAPLALTDFNQTNSLPLLDDAMTNTLPQFATNTSSTAVFVPLDQNVGMIQVGVRIDHSRACDLVLHLINPQGTRLLLAENRGWTNTLGYGITLTNVFTNFLGIIMKNGFEGGQPNGVYQVGDIIAGWSVITNNVTVYNSGGHGSANALAHSGTNYLHLNAPQAGAILTNLNTVVGADYLLSFAYARNPDAVSTAAAILVEGTNVLTVTAALPNSWDQLGWLTTSVVFHATSPSGSPLIVASSNSTTDGMLVDSFKVQQIQVLTNHYRYANFTEDLTKTQTPIKFGDPPYASTNLAFTNLVDTGFETVSATTYYSNQMVGGWQVLTNAVTVVSNAAEAYDGNQYLALSSAVISTNFVTIPQAEYRISFAHRNPGIVGWWPGDSNGLDIVGGNAATNRRGAGYAVGVVTNCFNLVPGSVVAIPDAPALALSPSLSIEAWINPTSYNPDTNGMIFFRGSDYRNTYAEIDHMPYWVSCWTNGLIRFHVEDDNGTSRAAFELTSSNAAPLNQWTHVAATLDGTTGAMSVYLNGVPDVRATTTAFPLINLTGDPNPGVAIGNRNADTIFTSVWQDFRGQIDEVSVYDRALSDAEVWGIYHATNSGKFDPLTPRANLAVQVPGVITNTVISGADWRFYSGTFTAVSNSTVVLLAGNPLGLLLDNIQIVETGNRYYLPEEPLKPMFGQSAQGWWQLELWDNQLGGPATNATLLSWDLQLGFIRRMPPAFQLVKQQLFTTNLAAGGDVLYFSFDVLCTNASSTITFSSGGGANLLFNQNQLPFTGGADFSFGPFPTGVNPFIVTLSANSTPPLTTSRFFLAVTNYAPSTTITLQVDSNCPDVPMAKAHITVSSLSSGSKSLQAGVTPKDLSGDPSQGATGIQMSWVASPSAQFYVQYTESLVNPQWVTIPTLIKSADGIFSFSDDGSYPQLSDGSTPAPSVPDNQNSTPRFASNRFYRVIQVR